MTVIDYCTNKKPNKYLKWSIFQRWIVDTSCFGRDWQGKNVTFKHKLENCCIYVKIIFLTNMKEVYKYMVKFQ